MVPPSTYQACSAATSPRARAKLAWYYRDMFGVPPDSSIIETPFIDQFGVTSPFLRGALIFRNLWNLGSSCLGVHEVARF